VQVGVGKMIKVHMHALIVTYKSLSSRAIFAGVVILMLDEKMDPSVAQKLLYGVADPLVSAYHVSYNMLLNMLRVEAADPEFLLRSSFHQYQQEQSAPAIEAEAETLEREKNAILIENEPEVEQYHTLTIQLEKTMNDMHVYMLKPEHCATFLQPGRLIRVKAKGSDEMVDWGWGIVVNYWSHRNSTSTHKGYI
jgi:ATP-dependent RNA helicase DOB1